jgi:hypothetical protein
MISRFQSSTSAVGKSWTVRSPGAGAIHAILQRDKLFLIFELQIIDFAVETIIRE